MEKSQRGNFYTGKMPDWLNQNEPPSINLRSSSGFQWGQWAGDGESSALLEPWDNWVLVTTIFICLCHCRNSANWCNSHWTKLVAWMMKLKGHTLLLKSLWWGSGTLQLQNTWITPNNTPAQTGSWGESTPKMHSKHFQVVRRSSKAVILGCLYQLNLPLSIKSPSL